MENLSCWLRGDLGVPEGLSPNLPPFGSGMLYPFPDLKGGCSFLYHELVYVEGVFAVQSEHLRWKQWSLGTSPICCDPYF